VRQLRAGPARAARRRRARDGGRHPPDPQIRQELSALSGWPTIPQVFVRGELLGGADIVEELQASGELRARLDEALGADREAGEKVAALATTA
jgi:monothiol glutaredoxin